MKTKIVFVFLSVVLIAVFCLFSYGRFSKPQDIFTEQERAWLNGHKGQIRIAITQLPPQIIVNKDMDYEGLAIDYIRLIEKKINFKFNLVYYDTWNILMDKMKERDSDVIFAAQKTPEREQFLQFTAPYIFLPNMIIVNQNKKGVLTLNDLKGMQVAVVKGSAVHEYLKTGYPDINLVLANDELDVLNKTSFGETYAAVLETSRASYYIQKREITNLRIGGSAEYEYQLRFASRNDWPELNRILEKALMSISGDEREIITRKWLYLNDRLSLEKYRRLLYLAGAFVLITVSFFIMISLWNRVLHKKVKERTAELNSYKNHLEDLVESRTADLKKINAELENALAEVETLSGFLPICSSCKKVRDDSGYWNQIEDYIAKHSHTEFSHSICPDCTEKLYGKEKWFNDEETPDKQK